MKDRFGHLGFLKAAFPEESFVLPFGYFQQSDLFLELVGIDRFVEDVGVSWYRAYDDLHSESERH